MVGMTNFFFVTRSKSNPVITPLKKRPGRKPAGVIEDQTILLGPTMEKYRQVVYQSPDDGRISHFLTNAFYVPARLVAELYKEWWQIEIFFKWIKQNLKVKTFLGTSSNAVKTQIWIALCVYLLLSYIKFKARIGCTIHQMLRVLQLNLFEKMDLLDLCRKRKIAEPPPITTHLPLLANL